MPDPTPRIDNAPYLSLAHGGLTVEGWSRAGIQSYWRVPELRVGFDLGTVPWDFTPTGTWFVTHAHLDHLMALPALLARRWMLKYPPTTVYLPAEIVDDVWALLAAWRALDRGAQDCTLVGMRPGDSVNLSALHHVTAFPTAHPVPARGYVVWERRQKLKEEYAGLPGDRLKQLRESGVALTAEVSVPLVCYTGDTGTGRPRRRPGGVCGQDPDHGVELRPGRAFQREDPRVRPPAPGRLRGPGRPVPERANHRRARHQPGRAGELPPVGQRAAFRRESGTDSMSGGRSPRAGSD